jgi:putative transposase
MLLAHKVKLSSTAEGAEYLRRCIGVRRFSDNALLAHFGQRSVKWSKAAAYAFFLKHVRQPWMAELKSRAPRDAIDDLHNAFQHFFRRVKAGEKKKGFPKFHKKGVNDSFALREPAKFDVNGRMLRLEKAPGLFRMRQALRWFGKTKSVTISERAGKFLASILVEVEAEFLNTGNGTVGVDFGVRKLAMVSTGEKVTANQKLKANLRRLNRRSRNVSRKQRGSNRRARAKLALAKLHKRIADQRTAVLHEVSDMLTRRFGTIVIEDLAVKNMLKCRNRARAIADAGFGALRRMIENKAALRRCKVVIAQRFFSSSKTCSCCGVIKEDLDGEEVFRCDACGLVVDRDLNAAINLGRHGHVSAGRKTHAGAA